MKRFIFFLPVICLSNLLSAQLPSRVNNAEKIFFRPIFNQANQECTQAAGIGYVFTYEMNLARNKIGSDQANWYPTHFTYNYINNGAGSETGLVDYAFNIAEDMGIPDINTYGGSMNALGTDGWMNGYNKYYAAMKNRAASYVKFKLSTDDDLQKIKRWMNNHDSNDTTPGGVVASNCFVGRWKYTTIPAGFYEAGKNLVYLSSKVLTNGHAITYVGYDDSIKFDINNDGKITNNIDINNDGKIDLRDRETGAFIVANSWGKNWKDNGFIYYMYQTAANFPNAIYGVVVKPSYEPKLTLKIRMLCNLRNRIKISTGIADTTSAGKPQFTQDYFAFNNSYGAGPYPMLGKTNTDTIELGLDVSSLADNLINTGKSSANVFLMVTDDDTAALSGKVVNMSCISYINNKNGTEYACSQNGVSIIRNGTIYLSVPNVPLKSLTANVKQTQNNRFKCQFVNNEVLVESPEPAYLNIFDIYGRTMYSTYIQSGSTHIPLSEPGEFLVSINTKKEKQVFKILACK